mmetsp:Transcript_4263/g.6923  ORF Transcript_4263/g.6923 Transcript_4263/m.6923 type:complete len:333 (+) Transcript_4263:838-1836(+)
MFAVPFDLFGRFAIKTKKETGGAAKGQTFILPHHARHVITAAKLVAETVSIHVKQYTSHTTKSFSGKELDFSIRLLWVNQSCRMDLDPFKIHSVCSHCHRHFQTIPSAMISISRWQMCQVRAMLDQQRIGAEVCAEAARANDYGPVFLNCVAIPGGTLDTDHVASGIFEKLFYLCLQHDFRSVRFLGNLLKFLHQGVSNRHSWEAFFAPMCARVRMTSQSRNKTQIEVEFIYQPIHGWRRLAAKYLYQIRTLRSSTHRVFSKGFWTVFNLQFTLRFCESAVDATGCLGTVATEESILVDDAHLHAMLEHCMRCGHAAEAATYNDDLLHDAYH